MKNGTIFDPAELSASEAAAKIAAGELSAEALMEACLARVDAREAEIKAWKHLDRDQALEAARKSDRSGQGPIRGVPVAVKDIIDTADMPTGYGSAIYEGYQPPSDASCVTLTRNAGGVIMGKTVTTEFAARAPGPTTNPHNPAHTPGGSSSGSAAAVASFMAPLAFGTQTVGSVLRPASYCGVYGYKPTYEEFGLQGVKENIGLVDTVGIFARSADDVALLRSAMLRIADNPLNAPDISDLRIGFCRTPVWDKVEAPIQALIEDAASRLSGAGATVEDLTLDEDDFEQSRAANMVIKSYGITRSLAWELASHYGQVSQTLKDTHLKGGTDISHAQYRDAVRVGDEYRPRFRAEIKDYDVVLTATALDEPPEGLAFTGDAIMNDLATRTHMPAISIPACIGPLGLPVGVQLIGHWGADHKFLEAAKTVAAVLMEG